MPHFGIKKCAIMGQPDKSYVNCALAHPMQVPSMSFASSLDSPWPHCVRLVIRIECVN